ncbi:MAG: hypothetical protein B7Y39_19705 [Bdellovibrio sp. 28-41-41]|nr:MAG: hypothetical protein B7Y39_19705 [Bdellovibrio sp. 28-41-41]
MSHSGFCAFCRSPKTYFKRRRLGILNILAALASAMAFNYLFRHQIEPIVGVIFVGNLFLIETAIQIRWRMSLICHECGFDPVIYKRNPELACIDIRKSDTIKTTFYPLMLPKRKQTKPSKHLAPTVSPVNAQTSSEITAL